LQAQRYDFVNYLSEECAMVRRGWAWGREHDAVCHHDARLVLIVHTALRAFSLLSLNRQDGLVAFLQSFISQLADRRA
jgi:hypothetical protein